MLKFSNAMLMFIFNSIIVNMNWIIISTRTTKNRLNLRRTELFPTDFCGMFL